jgi:CO/xanthine dehydrogenase Mo-binding subunit
MDLKVVGKPVGKIEGPDKVSGQTVYAADVRLPGMIWRKCLRSSVPHARLLKVDASRAKQVKGDHSQRAG